MADLSDATKSSFFGKLKSKSKYDKTIEDYKDWIVKSEKTETPLSVLEYIRNNEEKYSPSTLWVHFSIINKYFKVYHNVKLNDCVLLIDWLKSNEKKHNPKKSQVLELDHIENFLLRGEPAMLPEKAATVVALHGLMRISELVELCFNDVQLDGEKFKIFIKKSKTDQKSSGFFFYVTGLHVTYLKEYIQAFDKK